MNMHVPAPVETDEKFRQRLDLESALCDLEGDTLLLDLALEDLVRGLDWGLKTHEIHATADQVKALQHVVARVFFGAREASRKFYGREA